jgi:prepilin-type N-terminal cleavage/methylation domain-containing protein
MRQRRSGFTLLEVLVALCVITVGLIGLMGTLGPIARLAGQGRAHGRAAEAMLSRLDLLRAETLAGAPACLAPGAGTVMHPDGVTEAWSASVVGPLVQIQIVVGSDSLITRLPCP